MRCFPALLALTAAVPALSAQSPAAATTDFFEAKIRPVLANNCYACHASSAQSQGGLRVDSRDALLKGGGRGAAVVPGDPDQSWLIRAVRQSDPALKMPMGGQTFRFRSGRSGFMGQERRGLAGYNVGYKRNFDAGRGGQREQG